jgi:hypothetical protein
MSRRGRKTAAARIDPQRDWKAAREARLQSLMLGLGYVMVALSVIAGFILSFRPQALGLQGTPPAVAFALAALAGFRLYTLRMEVRRQERETAGAGMAPKRGARAPRRPV